MRFRHFVLLISPLLVPLCLQAQASSLPLRVLHASAGHDAQKATAGDAYSDKTEVLAALQMRLSQADPTHPGAVWFEFSADTRPGSRSTHLVVRVPLAGTEPTNPASGSCVGGPAATRTMVFTAAPDKKNSVPFQPSASLANVELSLNQYLCQALSVAYRCAGDDVALPKDWEQWRLARTARLLLTSEAPSTLELSPVAVIATDRPFSARQCMQPTSH